MKRMLSENGISIASIYGVFDLAKKENIEKAKAFIDSVKETGSKYALLVPGFSPDAAQMEQTAGKIAESLNILCEYAEKAEITLTIEDYPDRLAPYSSAREVERMLESVPKLSFTLDTGNFLFRNADILNETAKIGNRIVHIHCKDFSLSPRGDEQPTLISDNGEKLYGTYVGNGAVRYPRNRARSASGKRKSASRLSFRSIS